MALTESIGSFNPVEYYDQNDQTKIQGSHLQGYAYGTAATETVSLAPLTALSGTSGKYFHLTKVNGTIIGPYTTTASYSLTLAGNTIATFYTVGAFSLEWGPVGMVASDSEITSTAALVALHMSCGTKTACVADISVVGYYR